jgi:peptidyl-prolyl cis-trans isomerase A (cyclophilin A)
MTIRFALLAVFAALTLSASATAQPAPAGQPDAVHVALNTEVGVITLALDTLHAPITARNFLRYVDQKRLDGTVFYRVMRLDWGTPPNGLIQGGTQFDPKRILKPIAHEPTNVTGLSHKAGAISMARNKPGTATADFSILLSDLTSLDANPASSDPEAVAGFAVFGRVVAGMDVVRKIYDVPLSPTAGVGVMKGQMIARPVKILTARRVAAPPPPAAPSP